MERIEEIRTHPLFEDIKNNLRMRGIFISETNPYSYEDKIKELEERKVEPQDFLDYIIEKDMFNEELKSIELSQKALDNSEGLDEDIIETIQKVLDDDIATHKTTIRMKNRSEATIAIATKDIRNLKEEKIIALNINNSDILNFLTSFQKI